MSNVGCLFSRSVLKRAAGGQVYPTVDLFREAIDRKITYGNANGTYIVGSSTKCVKDEREHL